MTWAIAGCRERRPNATPSSNTWPRTSGRHASPALLERKLAAELHYPRADRRRCDVAERRRFDIRARNAERRMIEHVERFPAERESHPFVNRKRLEQRHVRDVLVRTAQNIPSRGAVGEDVL